MREITTRGQLREGNRPEEGRLWETGEPMNKNRIDRPTRPDELAPHSEVIRFRRGGKCGGCAGNTLPERHLSKTARRVLIVWPMAGNQCVLTWGDPLLREQQRKSAEAIVMRNEPGAGKCPLKHETGAEPAAAAGETDPA